MVFRPNRAVTAAPSFEMPACHRFTALWMLISADDNEYTWSDRRGHTDRIHLQWMLARLEQSGGGNRRAATIAR
jgi:hypothetical protein